MTPWPTATLRDVTTRITKGTTPTTIGGRFTFDGIAFVKVESITADGRINPAKLAFIDEDTNQLLGRSVLAADDLLFSIAGTVGRVARITPRDLPANTNQALAILRPNKDVVDVGYLLYCLRDEERIDRARTRIVQSVQANLSLSELADVELPLPPIREQRGIAASLAALDDKIACNYRAVDLIQQLSSSIFEHWRASNANTIATTFGAFADVFGGATPSTRESKYWGGDLAWATPTDVTALRAPYLWRTSRMITPEGLASTSAVLHPAGTILMTSRATIGAFAVNEVPCATNQGFIAVRPRRAEHRWFLIEEMRSRMPEMLDHANGSTFMELSRGNFKGLPLNVPTEAAFDELDFKLNPLHRKAAQLITECEILATLRNLLLPALLSGGIRVPEAAVSAKVSAI